MRFESSSITKGEKWYEIDDVQDLDIAETLLQRRVFRFIKSAMEVIGVFLLYWISAILVNPYFPPQRMVKR